MATSDFGSTAEPIIFGDEDGEGTLTLQRRHGSIRIVVNNAGDGCAFYLDALSADTIAMWLTAAARDCGNFAVLDAPPDDDDPDDDDPDDDDPDDDDSDPGWLARIQTARARLAVLNGGGA